MVPSVRNMEYSERLKLLNLQSLETRRLRIDMIQFYKFLKGHDKLDITNIIDIIDEPATRSNGLKITIKSGRRFKLDVFKHSFFCRSVGAWNSLPDFVVKSESI